MFQGVLSGKGGLSSHETGQRCPAETQQTMRIKTWISLLPLVAVLGACEDFGGGRSDGQGELRWVLEGDTELFTKATSHLPDTNDFLLTISDAGGKILYDGTYGDSPQSLPVDEGSYLVSVRSSDFPAPAFDSPQYGDRQLVVVRAGETVTVRLLCTMLNAGIRLRTGSDFLTAYPTGVLYVKSDKGRLMYAYREDRIAYFHPGAVSVTLFHEGKEETLLTRTLLSQQVLTLSLMASNAASGRSGIEVAVDTTRNWTSEDYLIGSGGNQGSGPSDACSVADAPLHIGEKDVWFCGYIVGGDLTATGKSVKTSGITKETHLALAARSSVTEKASCLAVELPKGAVRDALNLVSHPGLIGRQVYVRGDVVASYFGTSGLKSTSDFVLKE